MGLFSNTISEKEHFRVQMNLKNDSLQREFAIGLAIEERLGKINEALSKQEANFHNLIEVVGKLESIDIEEGLKTSIYGAITTVVEEQTIIVKEIGDFITYRGEMFTESQKLFEEVNTMIKKYERM